MLAPPGSPGGTFTLSNVPGGSPRRATSAASLRAKAAAGAKSGSRAPAGGLHTFVVAHQETHRRASMAVPPGASNPTGPQNGGLPTGGGWRTFAGMAEPSETTAARPRALPPAPARLIEEGSPIEGTWAGAIRDARFAGLGAEYAHGLLDRRMVEKRWQALFLATPQAMVSLAIVDGGYLSSGIFSVFDRGARRVLLDSNPVLPPLFARVDEEPNDGMRAVLDGPRIAARIERSGGRVLATARWGSGALDLSLDARAAPPPLSAALRLGPGRFNFTQKLVGLPAEGEIRVGNVRFPVRGEPAGLDFTHGHLARDTSWRWAFASARQKGRLIGFNLSEGFMQSGENAV